MAGTLRLPRTRRTLHHAARLQPGPWRWWAGLRAALSIGLPLLLGTLWGDQELGLVAAMGGFTALYGTDRSRREQWRLLPWVAVGLVLSAAAGAFLGGTMWTTALALTAVSAVAGAAAWGFRIGAPGALLFVLVAAISAHASNTLPPLHIPLLVMAGAVVASLAIMLVALLRNAQVANGPGTPLQFTWDRNVRRNVGRITAGVAVACLVSVWSEAFRLHWVVVTALAILQGAQDRSFTLVRVVQRISGTLLGLGLFQAILFLRPEGMGLVLVIMLLQFGIEVVVMRNYVLGLLFITPLALSLASFGQGIAPAATAIGRLHDTLLGAGVALSVLVVLEIKRRMDRSAT